MQFTAVVGTDSQIRKLHFVSPSKRQALKKAEEWLEPGEAVLEIRTSQLWHIPGELLYKDKDWVR